MSGPCPFGVDLHDDARRVQRLDQRHVEPDGGLAQLDQGEPLGEAECADEGEEVHQSAVRMVPSVPCEVAACSAALA